VKQAQKILDANWTGRYTKPSPGLYPHQWNWDSGFMAIGYAHYNEERAMQEIRSLFEHQWENGMVPQIVFNPEALGNLFSGTRLLADPWRQIDKRNYNAASPCHSLPAHIPACQKQTPSP